MGGGGGGSGGDEKGGRLCMIIYAGQINDPSQFNSHCLFYLHLHNHGCNAPAGREL